MLATLLLITCLVLLDLFMLVPVLVPVLADNAGVFRDIKQVGYRKVLDEKPGWKKVEVEQCGELKVRARTCCTYRVS